MRPHRYENVRYREHAGVEHAGDTERKGQTLAIEFREVVLAEFIIALRDIRDLFKFMLNVSGFAAGLDGIFWRLRPGPRPQNKLRPRLSDPQISVLILY